MEQLKVDANIGVVQKTTSIGTAHILRRVLERQEKIISNLLAVGDFLYGQPNNIDGILQ